METTVIRSAGLEGVVIGTTEISTIIDDQLSYVGYSIHDLVNNCKFEEIIYLLWNHKLPNEKELEEFTKELNSHMHLPVPYLAKVALLPNDAHPMSMIRTCVSLLGMYDPIEGDNSLEANKKRSFAIQAKMACIIAAYARYRRGLQPVAANPSFSFSKNFLYMLSGKEPSDNAVSQFDKAMILHADHELNASAFTARVCVATLSDMYSGVSSAVGALKGPLHGGANEAVIKMILEIGTVENVIPYLEDKFAKKEKIPGFGHRVYKNNDPRERHLRDMAQSLTEEAGMADLFKIAVTMEEYVKSRKNLPTNVDFYSSLVYHSLDFERDLFTPIFALSRTSGWIAHIMEQYDSNRLIRPRAEYVGPMDLVVVPIEQRG